MLHIFLDGKPWFAQKQYGLGSGLPISWKGWALFISYLAASLGMAFSFGQEGYYWEIAFAMVTLLFLIITWKKTDGGWQWKWGKTEEPYISRAQKRRQSRNDQSRTKK